MEARARRWLWLGVGAVIVGMIIYNLSRSPEWRDFRWDRFWFSIVQARLELLFPALAAVVTTYLIRALRWRCFLDPIKRASLWVLYVGQVLGFSSIFLIGRFGELVRPAYIAKKESVPMTAMVAVLLLERVYDTVCLVLLFAAALYFQPVAPSTARGMAVLATMHRGGYVMFFLTALVIVFLIVFRLRAEEFTTRLVYIFRFMPSGALRRFQHFLQSFAAGLSVIRSWKAFLQSVMWTAILWLTNVTVFWLVFQSLRRGLEHLPWLAAALTLFCAALGLAVQFPGIGGGYQVGVILALTEIFDVVPEAATGAAILVWIIISVPCLAMGAALLIHEGLTVKSLRAITEEEEALVEEA
jgi:uncharacterized membrane protein YbhN (UPF0104 family)